MRGSIQYKCNEYGNSKDAPEYRVEVTRAGDDVQVVFTLSEPAAGQGAGDTRGEVQEISLTLAASAAGSLASALRLAAVEATEATIAFEVDEALSPA